MTEAYCVRCRKRVEMAGEEEVEMRNGKKAIKGNCMGCGLTVYKIKPDKKADYW